MKKILLPAMAMLLSFSACKKQDSPVIPPVSKSSSNAAIHVEGEFAKQDGAFTVGSYRGNKVYYTMVNGKKMFEGDIVLNDTEETNLDIKTNSTGRSLPDYKWPGATVYFKIHSALPDITRVTNAIAHWQQNTVITLLERLNNETDYVEFIPSNDPNECSSEVGRTGGHQYIILGSGCDVGAVIHEIGHTVGLYHEQSRYDRDQYITINFDNIIPGKEHNFLSYAERSMDGFDYYGTGGLDLNSAMMYRPGAFSKNGGYTITTKDGLPYSTQRILSPDDISGVAYMYSPTKLKDLSWGANGSLYGIGTVKAAASGNGIFSWNGQHWVQQWGSGRSVAVSPNGQPWITNDTNEIFAFITSGWPNTYHWEQQIGSGTEIAFGGNSRFVLGTSYIDANGYGIYQWMGSGYAQISGSGVKIAADNQGNPWIINTSGNIYKRQGSGWVQIPGSARDIAIGADGSVYVIGTVQQNSAGYRIYKYYPGNNAFAQVGNGAGTAIAVAPNGTPCVINANGDFFIFDGAAWVQQ